MKREDAHLITVADHKRIVAKYEKQITLLIKCNQRMVKVNHNPFKSSCCGKPTWTTRLGNKVCTGCKRRVI